MYVCVYQANAVGGRNSTNMQEYLEKHWTEGLLEDEAIKLTVKTLLEVHGYWYYIVSVSIVIVTITISVVLVLVFVLLFLLLLLLLLLLFLFLLCCCCSSSSYDFYIYRSSINFLCMFLGGGLWQQEHGSGYYPFRSNSTGQHKYIYKNKSCIMCMHVSIYLCVYLCIYVSIYLYVLCSYNLQRRFILISYLPIIDDTVSS